MAKQLSDCCKAEINSNNEWKHRHECSKCGRHIGTPITMSHPIPQEVEEKLAEYKELDGVGWWKGKEPHNISREIWLTQALLSVYNSGREEFTIRDLIFWEPEARRYVESAKVKKAQASAPSSEDND